MYILVNRQNTPTSVSYRHSQPNDLQQINQVSFKEVIIMMTKAELQKKVDELRELKAMKEELENEVEETERQIISYMTEHEVTEEITDTAKITYKEQSRESLDKKKLEERFGSLAEFTKRTTYSVLRIK